MPFLKFTSKVIKLNHFCCEKTILDYGTFCCKQFDCFIGSVFVAFIAEWFLSLKLFYILKL